MLSQIRFGFETKSLEKNVAKSDSKHNALAKEHSRNTVEGHRRELKQKPKLVNNTIVSDSGFSEDQSLRSFFIREDN